MIIVVNCLFLWIGKTKQHALQVKIEPPSSNPAGEMMSQTSHDRLADCLWWGSKPPKLWPLGVSFQLLSRSSNRLESSGSWERMSSLCMKMGLTSTTTIATMGDAFWTTKWSQMIQAFTSASSTANCCRSAAKLLQSAPVDLELLPHLSQTQSWQTIQFIYDLVGTLWNVVKNGHQSLWFAANDTRCFHKKWAAPATPSPQSAVFRSIRPPSACRIRWIGPAKVAGASLKARMLSELNKSVNKWVEKSCSSVKNT